jgi:tetratricopeptide (TPR) repeat protein
MKKIILIYFFVFFNMVIYSETVTEQSITLKLSLKEEKDEKRENKINIVMQSEKEKEANIIQLAMIYFENEEIEKAIGELEKIVENERGFDYYYILGKINKRKNNYEDAIKNLEKAEEIQYENIEIKIALYEIYSESGGYEKYREKKRQEILESGISKEEKKLFIKLTEKYKKKYSIDYMGEVFTGGLLDTNVYNSKLKKESDGGFISGIMGGAVIKKGDFKKLYLAAAYRNKIYFSNRSENNHSFILTGEPVRKYKKWNISVPASCIILIKDSDIEESEFITGIKGSKKIWKNSEFTTGVDLGYKNNSILDYSGIEIYQYSKVKWISRYKINYEAELKLKDEMYDKDEYDNHGAKLKITSARVIKEKYKLLCKYGIDFSSYSKKEAGKKKNEITDIFNIEFEAPFMKWNWKYLIGYLYEVRDSNINSYDYSKNEISFKLKKEF